MPTPTTAPAKAPPADLSKGEYERWKDAQLIGHFEAWKRERRDNRARIERLESEVADLRAGLAEMKLSIALTAASAASTPSSLTLVHTPSALGAPPHLSVPGIITAPPALTADGVSAASNSASRLALPDAGGATAGGVVAGTGSAHGIRWADLEREKERATGVVGAAKKLPSMCDVR